LLVAAVFAALSMTLPAAAQGQLSISYWGNEDEARMIEGMIAACETETGLDVENIWLQADYVQQILTMIGGGAAPDVIMVSSGDLRGIMDQFRPLEGVDTSAYAQSYITDSMSVDGELRVVPFVAKAKAVAVNTRMFENAGVELPSATEPMTPEELAEKATAIASGEGDERVFGASRPWFGQWMFIFNGRFFNEDGSRFTVNTPEAIAALEYIENAELNLNFAPNFEQSGELSEVDMFTIDRIAMLQDFGVLFIPVLDAAEGLEWDLVPLHSPTWPFEVDGFGVSKDSDNPGAAQQFAVCIGQSDAAQTLLGSSISLGIPVTPAGQEAFFAADPDHNLAAYVVNMENAVLEQQTCMSSALWGEFYGAFFSETTVNGGDMSPADFLAEQEAYINSEFACE
jgi:ABC-type glycerol-3-phosphate transport system substrate-binding protein